MAYALAKQGVNLALAARREVPLAVTAAAALSRYMQVEGIAELTTRPIDNFIRCDHDHASMAAQFITTIPAVVLGRHIAPPHACPTVLIHKLPRAIGASSR